MRNDLKRARIAAGLTQRELADKVGKDQAAISRYEKGKLAPDLGVAPKLAKLLGLPILSVLYPDKQAAA